MTIQQKLVRELLLGWYDVHKRPLPWRGIRDPYRIWLSEIILQQTRVEQGKPYYLRFVEQYPSVNQLARASEQEVLRLWQGLGYYSRARNLHKAAQTVAEMYNGSFPETYEQLLGLKGIGEYTAAAIASIAFDKAHAVLDGNVYRVLSRLYADEMPINASAAKAHYTKLANALLEPSRPGDFNQAMMELGATVCTPKSPLCRQCPLMAHCTAFAQKTQESLPRKQPKKSAAKRYIHYLVMKNEDGLWLRPRGEGDIWQGLYDFPEIPVDEATEISSGTQARQALAAAAEKLLEAPIPYLETLYQMKHQLTHRQLHIAFHKIDMPGSDTLKARGYIFVPYSELGAYPLPRPVDIFLKEHLNKPEFW